MGEERTDDDIERTYLVELILDLIQPSSTHAASVARESDLPVLLLGPTGSGKTRFAAELHQSSSRRSGPFVVLNLASVSPGLIESELFGHERGAFTSANERRMGRLESANGGTIFLDEIAELPLPLQSRLLEFLQSHEIVPVGSNKKKRLNVRIIAATHRELPVEVENGRFRPDLYHRLKVIPVHFRTLSGLGPHFGAFFHVLLEEVCRERTAPLHRVTPDLASICEAYNWPGNVRELRNVLDFAVAAYQMELKGKSPAEASEIALGIKHLPNWLIAETAKTIDIPLALNENTAAENPPLRILAYESIPLFEDYHRTLEGLERRIFQLVLALDHNNLEAVARRLKINRSTLRRRLRALNFLKNENNQKKGLHHPDTGDTP